MDFKAEKCMTSIEHPKDKQARAQTQSLRVRDLIKIT